MKLSKFLVLSAICSAAIFLSGCIRNDSPDELGPTGQIPGAISDMPGSRGANVNGFDATAGSGFSDADGFVTGANGDSLTGGALHEAGWPVVEGVDFPIIYFDFDKDAIKDEEMEKIQQVASYIAEFPELGIIVEGHTDDVGTNEYNRALGERRAISIMNAFGNFGVGAERIRTISYGEDMPAANGTDNQSRAMNRRGVLLPAKMQ